MTFINTDFRLNPAKRFASFASEQNSRLKLRAETALTASLWTISGIVLAACGGGGGGGGPVISGQGQAINGTDSDDTLEGTDQNDRINGGDGEDKIYGRAGNDTLIGGGEHDVLYGGEGNDNLDGGGTGDWLYGNEGDDTLNAGDGGDWLDGGEGNDTMTGGAGDDVFVTRERGQNSIEMDVISDFNPDEIDEVLIYTRQVNNNYDGSTTFSQMLTGLGISFVQSGDDSVMTYANGNKIIFKNYAIDKNFHVSNFYFKIFIDDLTPSNNAYRGFNLNDSIDGNDLANIIYGADGNDWLYGKDGNDTLYGEAGDDRLYGSDDHDTLYGGDGNDFLHGGDGIDKLYGDADSDWIFGESDNDMLFGGEGLDFLFGGAGSDILDGGTGSDWIDGGAGADTLTGGAGLDVFVTEEHYRDPDNTNIDIDTINDFTFSQDDEIAITALEINTNYNATSTVSEMLAALNITLENQATDTVMTYDNGDQVIIKNFNIDLTQHASIFIFRVFIKDIIGDDYSSFALNDVVYGNDKNNVLNSGDGRDLLFGYGGNDTINGEGGNDTLYGQAGNDIINGGDGDDWLFGDDGNDILTGGSGSDVFTIDNIVAGEMDIIKDFNQSQSDQLRFEGNETASYLTVNALLSALGGAISQSGADTILTFNVIGGAYALTLENVAMADLAVSDFEIV